MKHKSHLTSKALRKIFTKEELMQMRLMNIESRVKVKNKIERKGKILKVYTGEGLFTLMDKSEE